MTEQPKAESWWRTVPGMLTGAAAVITATTGLLAVVQQNGWLRKSNAIAEDTLPQAIQSPRREMSTGSTKPGVLQLTPSLREVLLSGARFTLLSVRVETRNAETLGLRIGMRMTNQGPYPANFWNDSFRLLVDSVPRAPIGDLNKVVAGGSAEDGDVEFSFPATANTLVLQIRLGSEQTQIPLQWSDQ
jgi:hypothetical protein